MGSVNLHKFICENKYFGIKYIKYYFWWPEEKALNPYRFSFKKKKENVWCELNIGNKNPSRWKILHFIMFFLPLNFWYLHRTIFKLLHFFKIIVNIYLDPFNIYLCWDYLCLCMYSRWEIKESQIAIRLGIISF